MKVCCKCKQEKELDAFSKNKSKKDGYNTYCRPCMSSYIRENINNISAAKKKRYAEDRERILAVNKAYRDVRKDELNAKKREYKSSNKALINSINSARRFSKKKATPSWSEADKIHLVYEKASTLGFEVDHIVPLNGGKLVCGLHVWNNLQLLDKELNIAKGNRWWPDMPEEESYGQKAA